MNDEATITITMEEYKELLIIKGKYEELKEQLKQKEDIINKAKDLIESYYDFMEEEYDFKYFDGYKLLEILDIDKGE